MKPAPIMHASDWKGIRLVVFDVDGTLYNQRQLRMLMVRDLLCHLVHLAEIALDGFCRRAVSSITTFGGNGTMLLVSQIDYSPYITKADQK